jgi:hypothetical protein
MSKRLLIGFVPACAEPNADQPFMCLDLTFIWVLLEKGFGLRGDTKIFVSQRSCLTLV